MESDKTEENKLINLKGTKSDEEFLHRKRNIRNLKENYLFRRVLSGKIDGRYESTANTYYNMMAFDWDDEKLARNRTSISKIRYI
jgi:hypothetical protein